MYAVEVDFVDYITGKRRTDRLRVRYMTLKGAEREAARHNGICIPPGCAGKVSETWGRVVRV